jgi:hypothetical protein
MKTINIFDFTKFTDHYGPNTNPNLLTWEDCLRDYGIKNPVFIEDTFTVELTDEEYTWFILRWS